MARSIFAPPHRPMQPLEPSGPVPADPALPALAKALKPQSMRPHLQAVCGTEVASVEVSYVRYKPGQSCIVQYRTRGEEEHLLHGRMVPASRYAAVLAKATASHKASNGSRVHGVPGLGMVLVPFPHDRSVKGLRQILDPHKLKRIVQRQVARFTPSRYLVMGSDSRIEVVSYKPERRCLVRCHLQVKDRETRITRTEELYARIYQDDRGRRVHALLTALEQARGAEPDPDWAPLSLGYDPDQRILFCEALPGTAVPELVEHSSRLDACERAGQLLARLHASKAMVPRLVQAERLVEEARESAGRLAAAGVHEAVRFGEVARKLLAQRSGRSRRPVSLHGDFHPGQILADGPRLRLVDFDECGMGSAAFDVGYFVAHLRRMVLLGYLEAEHESSAAERFVAAYQAAAAHPVDDEDWQWQRDVTYLRMAINGVKHLEWEWPASAMAYLRDIGHG